MTYDIKHPTNQRAISGWQSSIYAYRYRLFRTILHNSWQKARKKIWSTVYLHDVTCCTFGDSSQPLHRFISSSRRGNIESLTSDNGTNYVGASQEIKKKIENWNIKHLENWFQQRAIKWNFNPPYSSYFGGVFERPIRSVRQVLDSIHTEQPMKLYDEDLNTMMCEIEAILNSRPLT